MKQLVLGLLLVALMGVPSLARGGVEGPASLNSDMATALHAANHYGWTCKRPPTLFQDGLTYWLEAQVEVKGDSVNEIKLENLYVEIYRELLTSLNAYKTIRPYLASFPITPDTFFLTLSVKSVIENEAKKCVSTAALRQGTLELDIETLFGREVQRKPFSEVKVFKELMAPKVQRTSRMFHARYPYITQLPHGADKEKKATFDTALKLCRRHALNILTLGSAGNDRGSSRLYQVAMCSAASLSLEKARKMAANCVFEFLRVAKKEKPFSYWQKRRSQEEIIKELLKEIVFRISFWTDSIDRPLAPAIAEIRFCEGSCEYFTADDNQQLIKVFEEKSWPELTL